MSWTPVVGLMQNLLTSMHLHFISHQPPQLERFKSSTQRFVCVSFSQNGPIWESCFKHCLNCRACGLVIAARCWCVFISGGDIPMSINHIWDDKSAPFNRYSCVCIVDRTRLEIYNSEIDFKFRAKLGKKEELWHLLT